VYSGLITGEVTQRFLFERIIDPIPDDVLIRIDTTIETGTAVEGYDLLSKKRSEVTAVSPCISRIYTFLPVSAWAAPPTPAPTVNRGLHVSPKQATKGAHGTMSLFVVGAAVKCCRVDLHALGRRGVASLVKSQRFRRLCSETSAGVSVDYGEALPGHMLRLLSGAVHSQQIGIDNGGDSKTVCEVDNWATIGRRWCSEGWSWGMRPRFWTCPRPR
jgi:hypothetical protein